MPESFSSIINNPEDLLSLAPAKLAGVVMEFLNSLPLSKQKGLLNPHVFAGEFGPDSYPQEYREPVAQALMEAWGWLDREGFVAPIVGDQNGWVFITRLGQRLKNSEDFAAFSKASILPKGLLHPVIAQKTWSDFLRGEYETAVFEAFKEVEVAVRDAGGFAATDIGVDLMRKAFHKDSGPLRDPALPDAERDAQAHFFAGAIGFYKNPGSHRHVVISEPEEATRLPLLASQLLFTVDEQKP
jgi:uncharacterized protein (TIGR02391 family)